MTSVFGRRSGMVRALAGAAAVAAMVASNITAAAAAEVPDIYDPSATIAEIAPEIARETTSPDSVDLTINNGSTGAIVSLSAPEAAAERRGAGEDVSGVASPELTFTAPYLVSEREKSGDISVWNTTSSAAAAYIQPMNGGVRILTAIADDSAPREYTYHLDVPAGTELRENDLGFMIWSAENDFLGQIHKPWARDSSGRDLDTHYEWNDGTLTQVVDLDVSGIDFPVLIDPAWTYGYSYDIALKSVAQTRNLLYSCFNCYFPVEGAPSWFPSPDEHLPLIVRAFPGAPFPLDFSCYFNNEQRTVYEGYTYFNYSFRASSTHVDGLGSWISFDFSPRDPSQAPAYAGTRLVVNAYIVNSNPPGGQWLYSEFARGNWATFANNIETG